MAEQQSTHVDAVSGAINSSHVMMNAAQNAINKTYGLTTDEEGNDE